MNVANILRRWDAIAYSQLCEHVQRLAAENDTLADALTRAVQDAQQAEYMAEPWRDDFMQLCEETNAQPGITQSGRLVAIKEN